MKILFLRIYNELKTKEFFEYLMQVLVQPSKFLAEQLMQVGRTRPGDKEDDSGRPGTLVSSVTPSPFAPKSSTSKVAAAGAA